MNYNFCSYMEFFTVKFLNQLTNLKLIYKIIGITYNIDFSTQLSNHKIQLKRNFK